jgi:MFS family permease
MGSFGLAFYAVVSAATAPLVAWMAEKLGPKLTWVLGELALGALLVCSIFVTSTYAAVAVIALFGFPWSVTMCVPFALTAQVAPRAERGLYMGALNIFIVLPQCCMAAIGPVLNAWWGDVNGIKGAMVLGGIGAFVSIFFVPRLIIKSGPDLHIDSEGENIVAASRADVEGVAADEEGDGTSERSALLSPKSA